MKKHICILDDSTMMRVFLGKLCEPFADVSLFSNPYDLLDAMGKGLHPDLILLDLKMPELSGFEILCHVTEQHNTKSPKVIVVSGVDKAEEKIKCLSLGAWDYLTKPFHPKELEIKVNRALSDGVPYSLHSAS
jgi:DNA-binding response OmpR family regulator